MEQLYAELFSLLGLLLTALVGWVTRHAVKFLKEKGLIAKMENNKEVVRIVVEAVEQSFKELDGHDKYQLAKGKAMKILKDNKVKVSEEEIDSLIESAVNEMNKELGKEIDFDLYTDEKESYK